MIPRANGNAKRKEKRNLNNSENDIYFIFGLFIDSR